MAKNKIGFIKAIALSPAEFTVADTVRVWSGNDVKTHIRTGF